MPMTPELKIAYKQVIADVQARQQALEKRPVFDIDVEWAEELSRVVEGLEQVAKESAKS